MLIYLINFLSIPVYALLDKNKRRVAAIICFQMLLILVFRAETLGGDLLNYATYYRTWPKYSFTEMIKATRFFLNHKSDWGLESGYVWFCWICAKIGFSFHDFLVIHAVICMSGLYKFLRDHTWNKALVIICMLAFGVYRTFFCALRQSLAFVIMLQSIESIERRKVWKFISILCCAVLFHRVTFPFIFIYFLYNIRITYKTFIWIYSICLILLVGMKKIYDMVLFPLLRMVGKDYMYKLGAFEMNNMIVLMFLLSVFVMVIGNIKKIFDCGIYRICFWGMMMALIIETVSIYIPPFSRAAITVYFPLAIVLVADAVYLQKRFRNRVILTTALFAFLFVFYLYQLVGDYVASGTCVPYISMFS